MFDAVSVGVMSDLQHLTIHGHDVTVRTAGSGPALLLVHGMAGSSATWGPVLRPLSRDFTVIAPDLLGHGQSEKPRGDYSLGAFASLLRDLLVALGHDRATVVGQSLGGGIAMQFAYQFPERCERLVLVGSGGLGPGGDPLLRAGPPPRARYLLPPPPPAGAVKRGPPGRAPLPPPPDPPRARPP